MSVSRYISRHFPSLEGKRVAVSGSTGGIGRQLCRHLASLGASLILLDRSRARSEALGEQLKQEFPSLSVSYVTLDLEDMNAVRSAAKQLLLDVPDFLVLNAGAYHIPRHVCDTGYENVFQINFIAPYFLARTLLPAIRKKGGRVVAVSSIAHDYSHADADDVDFRTRKKSSLTYGNAKRYLSYSLLALGDGVSITHPGITLTNITAHYPKLIFALIKHPMKVIFMSPRKASVSILAGLFDTDSQDTHWTGPRGFGVWGYPRKKPLRTAQADERALICSVADGIFQKIAEQGEDE